MEPEGLVSAEDARAQSSHLPEAWWPTDEKRQNERLTPFALPVWKPRFQLDRKASAFAIGSCFARNIEEHLRNQGFTVPIFEDPTVPLDQRGVGAARGVLNKYTPPSILWEVEFTSRLLKSGVTDSALVEPLVDLGDGTALDLHIASGWQPIPIQRCLERRRQVYETFKHVFSSRLLVITLGLIEAWWDEEKRMYIHSAPPADIMKRWPKRFFFKKLSYAECHDAIEMTVANVLANSVADPRILITTSPVPMNFSFTGQDVIAANCYSKSVLRAVAGAIYDSNPRVDYFPSYEMVTYSDQATLWQNDRQHVSDEAVARIMVYVTERLVAHGEPAPARSTLNRGDLSSALANERIGAESIEEICRLPIEILLDQILSVISEYRLKVLALLSRLIDAPSMDQSKLSMLSGAMIRSLSALEPGEYFAEAFQCYQNIRGYLRSVAENWQKRSMRSADESPNATALEWADKAILATSEIPELQHIHSRLVYDCRKMRSALGIAGEPASYGVVGKKAAPVHQHVFVRRIDDSIAAKDLVAAIRLTEDALKLYPKTPHFQFKKLWLLVQTNHREAAAEYWRTVDREALLRNVPSASEFLRKQRIL